MPGRKKQDEVGERNAMDYEQNMGIAIIFRKGLSILVLVSGLYEFGGPFWVAMLLDPFISVTPSQTKKKVIGKFLFVSKKGSSCFLF